MNYTIQFKMDVAKIFIGSILVMILMWYTAIWTHTNIHVSGEDDIPDFTMEVTQVSDSCERKSQADDVLLINYVIKLPKSNYVIESSFERNDPILVQLGQFTDIPTLERGLYDMCERESRKMVVPPSLAYGDKDTYTKGGNFIPRNTTLLYEVTLVKFIQPDEGDLNGENEEPLDRKRSLVDLMQIVQKSLKSGDFNNQDNMMEMATKLLSGQGFGDKIDVMGMVSQLLLNKGQNDLLGMASDMMSGGAMGNIQTMVKQLQGMIKQNRKRKEEL